MAPVRGESNRFRTQSDFQEQLDKPLVAVQEQAALREFLRTLSENLKVAILLDRRIDPDQRIDVRIQSPFLDEGLRELARPLDADVVVLADTLFLTTRANARTLRTRLRLAEGRRDEAVGGDFRRKVDLTRRAALAWDDLAQPRELVEAIARGAGLMVQNPDALPYDLWAAGCIAAPNSLEALLLVVSQFALDVEWVDADQVRLTAAARDPLVHRVHELPQRSIDEAVARIRSRFPDLPLKQSRRGLDVQALVEEHEEIAVLLGERAPRRSLAPLSADNLENRRFTLPPAQAPFRQFVALLRQQGIEVRFDEEELTAAGIDLETRIALELQDATIHQFLRAACAPLGLDYRIDGNRIDLSPQSSAPPER